MKKLAVLVCFVLASTFSSCKSGPESAGGMCVLQDNKPAKVSITHNGEEIGFCCDKCKDKFEGMSDADKAATLAKRHK